MRYVRDLFVPAAIRLDDIIDALLKYRSDDRIDLIRKAYALSAYCHKDQMRKDGSPYLSHPLAVAYILTQWRLDEVSIAAALLHDTLEDAPHLVSEADLQRVVGPEVTHIVRGLSKLAKHHFVSKEQRQAEYFMRMLMAAAEDPRVLYVKLADRLHNMMTLDAVEPEKQIRIALETQTIFAPMALRLGVGQAYAMLSDLSLKYLDPKNYRRIMAILERRLPVAEEVLGHIREILLADLHAHGLSRAEIHMRIKRPASIYRKMRRKNVPPEEIYDIFGVRILVDTVEQCYETLGIVHQRWNYIRDEFDDYIARPKPNGYQSIHTAILYPHAEEGLIPVEIQIRTYEMDQIAEWGLAAHLIYKGTIPSTDQRYLKWVRELQELQEQGASPEEIIRNLQHMLDFDKVYVYTPKGDILELPKGATPIDFAFHIHTDIGLHCAGARVNGRQVPLNYRLRTGDVVEILTHPQQTPSEGWLSFVVSKTARQKLRAFFRKQQQQERIRLIQEGRQRLERLLEPRQWEPQDLYRKLQEVKEYRKLFGNMGIQNLDDFLFYVGNGTIPVRRIATTLEKMEAESAQNLLQKLLQPFRGRRRSTADLVLQNSNHPLTVEYRRAMCCAPVPGEPVLLYFSHRPGRLPALHRRDCPQARQFRSDRVQTDIEWHPGERDRFPVALEIEVEDRPGALATILDVFQKFNINLGHVEAITHQGKGIITLVAQVPDAGLLQRIIKSIQSRSSVLRVERIGLDRVNFPARPAPVH